MILNFTVNYDPQWAELLRVNNWSLALLGNQILTGRWQESEAVILNTDNFRTWTAEIDASNCKYSIEYKYVIYDSEARKVIAWENRENRIIGIEKIKQSSISLVDEALYFDLAMFRGSGLAIPVFSLRSKDGFGIGEFNDLLGMIDWVVLTGQHLIQTLPINDTTQTYTDKDSYPYSAISVFALHPIYIHLDDLGELRDHKARDYFKAEKIELNKLDKIDFEKVLKLKWEYLRKIYAQDNESILENKEFKFFFSEHEDWLLPYSVFSFMRDREGTVQFENWSELSEYDDKEVDRIYLKEYDQVMLYAYVQFELYKQLTAVHQYAKSKGILLKGDIPIGVSPTSVDVWCNPELFHLDMQAGAPPDYFSVKGQNWGFPTYNWTLMAKDDFAWWKERLVYMNKFFDAYRIDHILGFFRIWEIPSHAKWGLLGQFMPSKPLSVDEIETYGFVFDEDEFLKPKITQDKLEKYFGPDIAEVELNFIEEHYLGEPELKEEFNTQKKIYDFYAAKGNELTKNDIKIRDKMLMLLSQVLFLEDHYKLGLYHPRISYINNDAYKALDKEDKENYLRLYEEFFYHRQNEFWSEQAMLKLPSLINSNPMLACGEDLGMIPAGVSQVMKDLNILSLEIQRMPKQIGQEFAVPFFAPHLSVCSTSTHDMSTIRAWWEEDPAKTQRFYNNMLFENGNAPSICEPWVAEKILWQHLQSPAMWVIIPLQDWMAIDAPLRRADPKAERINIPDDPDHVWNYRMHLSLEELIAAKDFNDKVYNMVTEGRR